MNNGFLLMALLVFNAFYLSTNPINAQQKPTLQLNAHIAFDGATSILFIDGNSNDLIAFKWLAPSVVFHGKNGKYQELELTNLSLQTAPDDETDTRFSMGIRYERGRQIGKENGGLLVLKAGVSLKSYLGFEQLTALNPNGLPTENSVFGLTLGIHPHLEYKIYKGLVFDFSPYCDLINGAARIEYVFDEFIDEEQRDSVDFDLIGFQFFLRFGLGWKF
jgi:hypothetical protein